LQTRHRARTAQGIRPFVVLSALALPGLVSAALIEGTAGPDVLEGTTGNDILNGKAGADTMMGLGGNDQYIVTQTDDEVIEGANEGTDTVKSSVSYSLPINVENLILTGGAAINGAGNDLDNRLQGNPGPNVLNGRAGSDTMLGSYGNDRYFVNVPTDVVIEPADGGTDTVISTASTFTLGNNVEVLQLTGSGNINGNGNNFANTIIGNTGNNVLFGSGGDDTIRGGEGNDQLLGGAGNDVLTGGAGADIFRFNSSLNETTNVDRITDFTPADDSIRLDGSVFTAFAVAGTIGAGAFRVGASAADPTDRILYDSATGILRYDPDGNGPTPAVKFATMAAGRAVTNADFQVLAPVATPVSFANQIQPIFNDNCTRCHSGSGAPRGLRLDAANSYANLVNVASSEVPSLKRIKPGDDDNSYLVHKIEGTQTVGGRMPLNSTPLSAANIALIRRWVVEGATNSGSTTTTPPPIGGY
jgi:Ca2+-binding RTX toxin-like protein